MRELALIVAVLAAFLCAPWLTDSGVVLNFLIMVLFATLLGQAWNILGGYGGQFSFGHAAFFGTGAYAMAVLQTVFAVNPWLALPLAILCGVLVALVIGVLSFRYGLRGSYFALVTLAFAEVLRILANTFDFTGAGVGLQLPLREAAGNMQFADKTGYLYLVLSFVAFGLMLSWWLRHSRYGAWLSAVRDNEASALALGIDALRVKLAAIMLSAALMAAAGAFYLQYFHYIDPHIAYGPAISIEALVGAIVGGLGSVFGPLLGALVLHLLDEATRNLMGDLPGISLVVYGVVLVLIVMFIPRGLSGLFGRRA